MRSVIAPEQKTKQPKVNKVNRNERKEQREPRKVCICSRVWSLCGRKTAQSDILISVDFIAEIVRDKFEISSIYGCSLRHRNQHTLGNNKGNSGLFMILVSNHFPCVWIKWVPLHTVRSMRDSIFRIDFIFAKHLKIEIDRYTWSSNDKERNSCETEINKYSDEIPQIKSRNTANIFVYLLNFCRWTQQLLLPLLLLCVKPGSSIFCKVFCRWRIFSYGVFFVVFDMYRFMQSGIFVRILL